MMAVKLIKEGLLNRPTGTFWIACIHMTTTQTQNYKTNTWEHSFVSLPGTNHSKSPPPDSPICTLSQCWRQFLVALNIWMALYLLCNAMALLWQEMRFFVINTVYVACFRFHVDNGHNEWIITKGMKIKLLYQQVSCQCKLQNQPTSWNSDCTSVTKTSWYKHHSRTEYGNYRSDISVHIWAVTLG